MTNGNHYEQHNTAENVYTTQGASMYIYQQAREDYFADGLMAMDRGLYRNAVELFEKYLSTAAPSAGGQDNGSVEKVAKAHFCAAIALLGKGPPGYKMPADIDRINDHLDQARRSGQGYPVFHQASVLWAVLKEDYYEAYGQDVPEPPIVELQQSIERLSARELEIFVEHIAGTATRSWRCLAEHAQELGIELRVPDEDAPRKVDRERPEAVRKYFMRTPDRVTPAWAVVALSAGLLAIVLGVIVGGSVMVALLAAGGFLLFLSAVRYIDYLAYLQEYERAEPKPTDEQMDHWLHDDLDTLIRRAARRLRLNTGLRHEGGDLLVRPLTVVGIPEDEEYLGMVRRVRVQKGADGRLRANVYDVYVLFMTRDLVSTYRCVLNFSTGYLIYDLSQEHHYRDIVGVHSASIPIPRNLIEVLESASGIGSEPSLAERAALSITSGEIFTINIGIASHGQQGKVEVAWPNKHALNILQKMIRAHHND